jgi:hypothetical protein
LAPPRLDRIVRGRAWIPVLGVLLVAIVGLRVEVLKLGSGVGARIQQATLLQSSDSLLRSQVSALSDNHRIITLAEGYGMYMPAPLDVHLVSSAAGTHLGAAARNISAPSRTTFLSALASEQQAAGQNGQIVSTTATSTSGEGAATDPTVSATSGGAAGGTTDTAVAPTTNADTSNATTNDATTSSLGTSSSTADATDSPATDATSSSTTGGGSGDVSTGLPDTSTPPSSSQTTDSADSATGSTTGGTGLAG